MNKTSFPLHGFIVFLHRIKLGHRNSDERPNESFAARWYFGESHLPHRYGNRHVRQSPAESALSESTTAILHQTRWSFSRTGGFQHSLLLCNDSRIRRLCGKNLKLCEVTVKSKRGQHATFLHVAQRDFAVKQTGDLTDKRQPQTAAFLPICTRQRVKAFKNT